MQQLPYFWLTDSSKLKWPQKTKVKTNKVCKNGCNDVHTILDSTTLFLGAIITMSNVALIAGSSQQGNALRASVDYNIHKSVEFCIEITKTH